MNSKAPVPGSREAIDAESARRDGPQRRTEPTSSSIVTGPQARRPGAEAHAALSGDLHDMLGNSIVRAALSGMEAGPGTVIEDALTLGAAGVQVADSASGLFANQFMQQQLAANAPSVVVAASARPVSRHGGGEDFSETAGKKVDVALKRGGQPLPDDLRARMEAAFGGADFSGVRIHTDGAATAAAHGIHAHAFAVGQHVYFGSGEFRPHSREGQELLAHELTHVVQHQEGRIPTSGGSGGQAGDVAVSSPNDAHEREAVAMATEIIGSLGAVERGIEAAEVETGEEQAAVAGSAPGPGQASEVGQLSRSEDASCETTGLLDRLNPVKTFFGTNSTDYEDWQKATELQTSVEDSIKDLKKELKTAQQAVKYLEKVGKNASIDKFQEACEAMDAAVNAHSMLSLLSKVLSKVGIKVPLSTSTTADPEVVVGKAKGVLEGKFDEMLKFDTSMGKSKRPKSLKGVVDKVDSVKSLIGQLAEFKTDIDYLKKELAQYESQLADIKETIDDMDDFSHCEDESKKGGFNLKQAPGKHTARSARATLPGTTGRALPSQTAAALRATLGPAVDSVRVHTGPEAARFAQSLGARAVTVGQDIYFNRGEYQPGTTVGDQLIGHEVHHAVIGGGGPGVSRPGDSHEREADAFGDRFVDAGGTQALTRMGLQAPSEALASQVDDRLTGVARSGPAAAQVAPELVSPDSASSAPEVSAESPATDVSAASFAVETVSATTPSLDLAASAPVVDFAPELDITPVATPMGSELSLSRDVLTGTATGASDTTSGTQETAAETHAELTIAGKKFRVKVPPSEGQTATANCDLDERPCEGLHLHGATVNIDETGKVVGGTVRGTLEVPGLFNGTEVALAILPGGAIAPAVENLPVKVGPASGTVNLSITEAGLEGSGSIAAAELGLPEWVGLRAGQLEIAFSAGEVSGGGTLTGTTTATGTAVLEATLADQTLTSEITYTVTPGLSPAPGIVIDNAQLSGTLVTPLASEDGGGDAAGPGADARGPGESVRPSGMDGDRQAGPAAQPGADGGGGGGAQQAMQNNVATVAPGGQGSDGPQQGADQGVDQSPGATGGGGGEGGGGGGGGRDPNAFMLRGSGKVTLKEWVTGDVELAMDPMGGTYDVSGTLSAAREMQIGELLAIKSEVSLTVVQNVATESAAIVDFTGPRYAGQITGDYDIQAHQLDGTAKIGLTEDWPIEGEWGSLTLKKGGSLDANVEDNKLIDVNGRVGFEGQITGTSETPLTFEGNLEGTFDGEKEEVEGTATGATTGDYILPSLSEGGTAEKFTLLSGSSVRAEVKASTVETIKMGAVLQYDREGEPFLSGELADATYELADSTLSGKGTFTLLKDLERQTKDGKWTIRIKAGTNIDATVEKNSLKEIGGDITVQVDDAQGPLANGQLTAAKIDVATWETSGKLKLTTARKFFHPGEGQTMANGYSLAVMTGSGINATVKKDELTEVGGDLRCMISDEEGALARLRLVATLDLKNNEVDGTGTLALARQVVVAENLAGQGWTAKALRGSKAVGHLEKGEFTKVTGELKARVDDEQGQFLRIDGTGEWTTADDLYSIVGTVTVKKEKELAEGGEGGWSLSLMPDESSATATIEKDVFKGIDGTVSTMVRKAGEDFASVKLGGSWNETQGFTGEGEAELLTDIEVTELGDYELLVVKGTGARIGVEQNNIDEIGGQVPMRLDDQGTQFIKAGVEGTYQIPEKQLDGTGNAEVLVEKHLGTLGDDQLWLVPSTSATVTIAANELTEVGGEMNLSVRTDEGEYAKVALQGTFDAKGGTGFTGTGAVTVVRDNKLFEVEGYSFWLKEGTGATAHIEKDELKKIDGSVPFMVKDGGTEALIEGSVDGTYDAATGEISGTGAVYLGRDLTYDLGSGIQLKLIKGSGGDADVTKSKLERLGGTLTAEIWKDGEGIVRVTASGEYNVVTNTLTSLTGTATLLKPLELLGGAVEVSNVSGTATIENNELVEAGGRGDLVIHPLNDMKGWFEVSWSNRGGVEKYEGTGNVEFTLIDKDPETGRGMGGEIGVTANSDGSFEAVGEIDYDINEIIGGKLQVSVDQTWNPKVYGTIAIDTNLVEARDLFSMERDIIPETPVRLPYGLALFYGMKGGMAMALDALHLQSSITVGDWHPLQEGDVPKFQSNLDLTWGMNFNAMVAPYIGLGGDIGFASASMGVRGEVELNAPVKATAGGEIKGEGGGFYGELSVGVSIAPTIDLAIIPYIKGEIIDLFSFEEDLDRFEQPLGTIFEFEWGRTYGFGDTEYKNQAPIEPMDVPAPKHKETKTEGRPSLGMGNSSGGGGQAKKGAPQLESGSEIAGQQQVGDGQMSEVMDTLNDVIAVVEGLGAAGELMGMLVGALAALATFGPAGLVVHIVWGIFTGDLSWDKIKTAVTKVVDAIAAAGRLLRKHFPGWWNSIVDTFNGEKPGLLDALFGADDRMREAVGRGDHEFAPYDMHKEMVNTMKGGWLSDDDANCIAQVFEVAAQRGWLGRLVSDCGGADEFIDGWSTGFNDERIKRVFNRNGIRY